MSFLSFCQNFTIFLLLFFRLVAILNISTFLGKVWSTMTIESRWAIKLHSYIYSKKSSHVIPQCSFYQMNMKMTGGCAGIYKDILVLYSALPLTVKSFTVWSLTQLSLYSYCQLCSRSVTNAWKDRNYHFPFLQWVGQGIKTPLTSISMFEF